MSWTLERYPLSMKNLPPLVREKAILMANALLAEGYAEGHAIRIAIGQARAWAKRRHIDGVNDEPDEGETIH